MISEIKRHSTRTDDPLEWIPDIYEAVAEARRNSPNRKTPIRSHTLPSAATEVLAPCIFESFQHVKDNWSDFRDRWTVRHSAFWSQSGAAYRFVLGDVGGRTNVHCSCGGHYDLERLPVAEWRIIQ